MQHELWAKTIHGDVLETLLDGLDGKRADQYTLGDAREAVQSIDPYFSALDFMTMRNNAYHAGIIVDGEDGKYLVDRERLAEVRGLPIGKDGFIRVDCCFSECKG